MDSDYVEDSPTADEHLDRAYQLEEEGKLGQALAECNAAIEIGRSFLADAYNLRGIVQEGLGQGDQALEAYQAALEFQPGFEAALENLEELEDELGLSDEPVTIARFGSAGEAHLAQGRLETEGIESFVADEVAVATLGVSATVGIRLQVGASDADQALEILGIEPEDEVSCPQCGSWDVRAPLLGKEWRCKDCDHRWTM